MSNCKVIALTNQKGGVGKTTTAVNLGVSLAQQGKKVLLIDADAQANLTMSLGYHRPDDLQVTLSTIMQDIIDDKSVDVAQGILHHGEGVDLLPSNIELSGLEVRLINAISRESVLKTCVNEVKKNYDYVLVDCMPSLGMLTINALAAADSVVIPTQPHYLSAKGLELLLRSVSKVKRQINPPLRIDGILMTMVMPRTNISKEITATVRSAYGQKIDSSLTPDNAAWWNPVTASQSCQGKALKQSLESYITFHTAANLGSYGMDEITDFNIYDVYLPECKEMTEQLAEMIHDILETSRLSISAANEEAVQTNISKTLSTLCEPYILIAEAKGVLFQLELSEDISAVLPQHMFEKAVSNILANAVAYTETGKIVSVYFDDNDLIIENECSPIPAEILRHLFEPFYRPDFARNRDDGGNGLGLYIVATLFHTMGISYSFAPMIQPQGMRFTINLK